MNADEQAIRAAVQSWMQASAGGDLPRVLALMDDDVVFIGPGRPAMRGRDASAAASKRMEGKVRIEGASDRRELGDLPRRQHGHDSRKNRGDR